MQERWQAHLCGLCLTLRDAAGQSARVLTGYDALLLSVLVEAQAGALPTTTAGRCPLRGMRTAEVVRADQPAAQLAAAGSLLSGAAGLQDKLADGDLPRGTCSTARLASARYEQKGVALAGRVRLDPTVILGAAAAARAVETGAESSLDDLLAPSGAVVAGLFAHTAVVAGCPDNVRALARAGDAFGRLVHLLDAVDDRAEDDRRGAFNPLSATATTHGDAHRLARNLTRAVTDALDEVMMAEPALALRLLGPELDRAVARRFPASGVVAPVVAMSGVASLLLCDNTRRAGRMRRDARQRGRNSGGDTGDSACAPCCDVCDPCSCCAEIDCGECCNACECGDCCDGCDGCDCCSC